MKYSEYLQLVKSFLLTPDNANVLYVFRPAGVGQEAYLCCANDEASRAIEGVGEYPDQYPDQLRERIHAEIVRLNLATGYAWASYPTALGYYLGLAQPEMDDGPWRQKVRHELLDKWIAEAEANEQAKEAS